MGIFSGLNAALYMPNTYNNIKTLMDVFTKTSKETASALVKLSLTDEFMPKDDYDPDANVEVSLAFSLLDGISKTLIYIQKDKNDCGFEIQYVINMSNNEDVMSFKTIAYDERFPVPFTIDLDTLVNTKVANVVAYMHDFEFTSKTITEKEIHACINPTFTTQ